MSDIYTENSIHKKFVSRFGSYSAKILSAMSVLARRIIFYFAVMSTALFAILTVLGFVRATEEAGDALNSITIDRFLSTGHLYFDVNLPPQLWTAYGPVFYTLFSVAYFISTKTGIDPQIGMRVLQTGIFLGALYLAYLSSKSLFGSALLSVLSVGLICTFLQFADLATAIRPDLLGFIFAFSAVFMASRGFRNRDAAFSAILCALALLTKLTYIAAPISIFSFYLVTGRYNLLTRFCLYYVTLIACGYAILFVRESLLIDNFHSVSNPVFEYKYGLNAIILPLLSSIIYVYTILGLIRLNFVSPAKALLYGLYLPFSWIVSIVTAFQAGSGENYFWEPVIVSAVLAAGGVEILRNLDSQPKSVTLPLALFIFAGFLSPSIGIVRDLVPTYGKIEQLPQQRREWAMLRTITQPRNVLSTIPAVVLHSRNQEMADPFFIGMRQLSNAWSFAPVIARLRRHEYDFVVVGPGELALGGDVYRGVPIWNDDVRRATTNSYVLRCKLRSAEIWIPNTASLAMAAPCVDETGLRKAFLPS